ncbi:MAG: DUF2723 domain-containing protein [Oligoflexia bacterium]|nr:DUF2723 domain-containing protein [Oligoflexia bacterium]
MIKKKQKKKNQLQHTLQEVSLASVVYDIHKREIVIDALIAFALVFIYYLSAIAPSVTFEDSGEFIAAMDSLGVAHPPGYPLLVLLGKLFITIIPFGTIAFRANLVSAFCSAISIGIFCLIAHLWICYFFSAFERIDRKVIRFLVVAFALFIGSTPDFLAQSLITEVYGLNNFHCSIMLYLISYFITANVGERSKERVLYLYAFVSSLCFSNHHTAALFVLFGPLCFWLFDRPFVMNGKRIAIYGVCFIVGLAPLLYLPWSAMQNPKMNWGNPSTLSNFWIVFSRHQYSVLLEARSLEKLGLQLFLQLKLLLENLRYAPFMLSLLGLYFVYKKNRRLFFCSLVLLVLSGPITVWIFDPDVVNKNLFSRFQDEELARVFFLIHYYYWVLLGLLGTLFFLNKREREIRVIFVTAATTLLLINLGYIHHQKSMSSYKYPEQLFNNLMILSEEKSSLFISNCDPFSFSMMYFHGVEARAANSYFIDIELLRGSWYVHLMQQWYPELMKKSEKEAKLFVENVTLFENDKPYNVEVLDKAYYDLLNSIIDNALEKMPVYFVIYPFLKPIDRKIAAKHRIESCYVSYCVLAQGQASPLIDESKFDFSDLGKDVVLPDRMSNMISTFYGFLQFEKAEEIKRLTQDPNNAISEKHLTKARELVRDPLIKERFFL